jgi:hypothetical protein
LERKEGNVADDIKEKKALKKMTLKRRMFISRR